MAADVLLFCERKKWHGRNITRALKARGINPLTVSLSACGFSTATPTGLAITGLGDHLPRGALVLFVPGGSFEQVTLYLGVLHALRELGVRVWNDARAIERCVDKSTTTFFLQKAAIPTPRTWSGTSRDQAEAIVEAARRNGVTLVQKPLFGAQGEGLRLIETVADLAPDEEVNSAFYLQEFIPRTDGVYRDWRVFVSGGRVVAAMIRHGTSWITNITQGARAEAAIPSQEIADLALRAVLAVGADYAGVDIIQDGDGNHLVLEVNSMPAWQGLQRVTRTPIADSIVVPFLDACLARQPATGEEGA
jgi:tetrahydromethanopterin:alpha-L-glutamate ligase